MSSRFSIAPRKNPFRPAAARRLRSGARRPADFNSTGLSKSMRGKGLPSPHPQRLRNKLFSKRDFSGTAPRADFFRKQRGAMRAECRSDGG